MTTQCSIGGDLFSGISEGIMSPQLFNILHTFYLVGCIRIIATPSNTHRTQSLSPARFLSIQDG